MKTFIESKNGLLKGNINYNRKASPWLYLLDYLGKIHDYEMGYQLPPLLKMNSNNKVKERKKSKLSDKHTKIQYFHKKTNFERLSPANGFF